MTRLAVYKKPILAAFWSGRDKAGARETRWEAGTDTPYRITGASQARNKVMTNDVGLGSPRAHGTMAVAQRMTAIDISLPPSGFGMRSRSVLEVIWYSTNS